MLRISNVTPLEGFRVLLILTDGRVIERDIEVMLRGSIFEQIRGNSDLFRQVRVEAGGLVWPNGADLCPDMVIWGGPPPEFDPEEASVSEVRL